MAGGEKGSPERAPAPEKLAYFVSNASPATLPISHIFAALTRTSGPAMSHHKPLFTHARDYSTLTPMQKFLVGSWWCPYKDTRREIEFQLRNRTSEVWNGWHVNEETKTIACVAAAIIKEAFYWPTDYFLPEDPLWLVFRNKYSVDIAEALIFNDLTKRYSLPRHFFREPPNTFGEFVNRIHDFTQNQNSPPVPPQTKTS